MILVTRLSHRFRVVYAFTDGVPEHCGIFPQAGNPQTCRGQAIDVGVPEHRRKFKHGAHLCD